MEKFSELVNKAELTEDEKLLLADTIKFGEWGDCPEIDVHGDTLVECLLCAVLRMARK